MGNTILSYPDYTMDATTTLFGGSWAGTLPLSNLKDRLLSKVARTTDASASSTIVNVQLSTNSIIRVIALLGHNLSLSATVRFRIFQDVPATILLYDSGYMTPWPASYTAADILNAPAHLVVAPGISITTGIRVIVEIVDTGNASGYVQLGRVWVGPGWQPTVGIAYGDEVGYDPQSITSFSLGGIPWFDVRPARRSAVITFPGITDVEKRTAMIFQKTMGGTGEVLYIQDKTHVAEDMILYAFPATVTKVSKIKSLFYNSSEFPIELTENI